MPQAASDGLKSDEEYERELGTLRAMLDVAVPITVAPTLDVAKALQLLDDMAGLINEATVLEQQAVFGQIVERVVKL